MKEKIKILMQELMQHNCICNYVLVQNGSETFVKNIHALDIYMKTYELSANGNIECFMAPLGMHNKAVSPIFTVIDGIASLQGIEI